MKLDELKQAYPPVSPACRDAMLHTARRVSSQERRVRKLSAGLVFAIVMALALVGAAYAAVRLGIIDYLIGGQKPSEGMVKSAQQVEARGQMDNIEITITGALYDGERLSLSWSVENKKPEEFLSLRLLSVTLGGENVDPEFSSMNTMEYRNWAPSVFGMQEATWSRNPEHGGMLSRAMEQSMTGRQEVVVEFDVVRPKKPIVMLEPTFEENYLAEETCPEGVDPEWWAEAAASTRTDALTMLEAMKASGVTLADEAHQSASWWWEQGYMVVDHGGDIVPPEASVRDGSIDWEEADAYRMERQVEDVGTLTLRFWLDADEGRAYRRDAWVAKDGAGVGQGVIALPGCTAQMRRLSLTPLSTRILLQLSPLENTEEAARKLEETYGWLEVTDESGQELDCADMESATWSPNVVKTEEEQWVLEWDWYTAGVQTFPREIHFGMRVDFEEETEPTQEQKAALEAFAQKMVFVEVE